MRQRTSAKKRRSWTASKQQFASSDLRRQKHIGRFLTYLPAFPFLDVPMPDRDATAQQPANRFET